MGTMNLHRMFNPKTVAIIGADEEKGSAGFSILNHLIKGGFKGGIFPVNPEKHQVMGLPCFPDIEAVKALVDMAVITSPAQILPDIIDACGRSGLAGVAITPSAEKDAQPLLLKKARKYNLRILGPACLGIINTSISLNASLVKLPLPGKTAFLSQSDTICTFVLDLARRKSAGFSHFISLGDIIDIDFADMIDYLGSIHSVESIALYMERMTHLRNFMSAARSVSRVKPIIALKAGRSDAGARTAATHTGEQVVEDAVYDAAFQRAGILRINEFEELLDCSVFLPKLNRVVGSGLIIITRAGSPDVMAVDDLAGYGLEPPALSKETIRKLDRLLPKNQSRENPIDIPEDITPEIYHDILKICADAPETDALLLMESAAGIPDITEFATHLIPCLKTLPCPVFTVWIGEAPVEDIQKPFNDAGMVVYDSAERAVRAFKNLCQYSRNMTSLMEIPIRRDQKITINHDRAENIIKNALASGKKNLSGISAANLLQAYGIPVGGSPLPEPLKSDARQPSPREDCELMMGLKTDPQFGPVIIFGMGGALTDVFRDTSMGLPPLNHLLARRMIDETKISKVLTGSGKLKKTCIPLLEELLIRMGRLAVDFPEITTVDINPLMVCNDRITADKARVSIAPPDVLSPMHLIISSYPRHYEKEDYTVNGEKFFIRPIQPGDADLLVDHFNSLSPRSVYMRFFSPLKELSRIMLIKLTQIDYDREIALVAMMGKETDQKMVGVCRIIIEPDKTLGEFAMAISDEWHGQGIGSSLLKQCLKAAQSKGVKKVMGIVLAENTQMLKLGSKLGFTVKKIPSGSEYELIIDYNKMNID